MSARRANDLGGSGNGYCGGHRDQGQGLHRRRVGRAGGGGWSAVFAVPSGEEVRPESMWVAGAEDVLRPALRRAAEAHLKRSPDWGGGSSYDEKNVKALSDSTGNMDDSAWLIQGDGIDFMSKEVGFDNAFLHLTKTELEPALAPQSPLRTILHM